MDAASVVAEIETLKPDDEPGFSFIGDEYISVVSGFSIQ
jgi:hypothetical protein